MYPIFVAIIIYKSKKKVFYNINLHFNNEILLVTHVGYCSDVAEGFE